MEDSVNDILQDAKLYQDATIEDWNAYEALKQKYSKQVHLMEEASGALFAAESQASQKQQELLDLQKRHEADIQLAIGKALVPYKEQLSSVNHNLQAKDCAVKKLQKHVCALEISLTSQANLPSVRQSWEEADLCKEVFDYVPQTVNTRQGATTYESKDQAFPFQKHVHFRNGLVVPDLKLDSGPNDPLNSSHAVPHSSTPH